jgi:hypothetical protein
MTKSSAPLKPLPEPNAPTPGIHFAQQTEAQKKAVADEALMKRANADTPFDYRGNITEPARDIV